MKVIKKLLKKHQQKNVFQQQLALIRQSEYFDAEFYLQTYPDVAAAGYSAEEHFLKFGGFEGRKPSQQFDPEFYLQRYPDVADSGVNPLLHFLSYGLNEGREPLPAQTYLPADDVEKSIDSGLQLLQLHLLQGQYAAFDQLIHSLKQNQLVSGQSLGTSLQTLQLERWLAVGDVEACRAWLRTQQSYPFYWYYQARLHLLQGKSQAAMAAVQSFLFSQPQSAEGHYLLAECAEAPEMQASVRLTLGQFVSQSRRGRSWQHLAQLVQTPADLEHYLGRLRQWCLAKPGSKYVPEVALATAAAAIRGGNEALAKQVLHDCIAFHQSRKNGFQLLKKTKLKYSQHLHLPLWPQPFQQLPAAAALNCQQRLQNALADLYKTLDSLPHQPFLLQQSLQAWINDVAFASDKPLTLGLAPQADVTAISQALKCSGLFLLIEQTPFCLSVKHNNGASLLLYCHQQQGEGWQYCDHGVCWQTPVVHIIAQQRGALSVMLPSEPEQYLASYSADWQQAQIDWVVQSTNRHIVDSNRYSLYCYQQLLQALIAEDRNTEVLMLRQLTEYESKQSYQQLVGSNYCIPTLEQIQADGIQLILYVTGLEKVAYQGNMWIPVLERLPVKSAIVIREKQTAEDLIQTKLPVYFMNTMRDLELLDAAGVKTILYPANTQKNVQTLRFHKMNHFFINHGDSDKVVNQSKFLMAYDKLLVAGPMAEQRIRNAGLPVRDEQIVHVGRPQVELSLQRIEGACKAVSTILYAPTWEGFVEEANYSSVNAMGLAKLEALLQTGRFQVLFKPHPYTGYNKEGVCGYYLEEMRALTSRYPQLKCFDSSVDIHTLMNQSDLLITDISSVLNDYLHTLKPIILMNPKAYSDAELGQTFPSSVAAYICHESTDMVSLLEAIPTQDIKFADRVYICKQSLGDFPEGSLARFTSVVMASCT